MMSMLYLNKMEKILLTSSGETEKGVEMKSRAKIPYLKKEVRFFYARERK